MPPNAAFHVNILQIQLITSFQITSSRWSAPAHSARFSGLLTMVKKKKKKPSACSAVFAPLFLIFFYTINWTQFQKVFQSKHITLRVNMLSFLSAEVFCHLFYVFVYSFWKSDWTHSLRHSIVKKKDALQPLKAVYLLWWFTFSTLFTNTHFVFNHASSWTPQLISTSLPTYVLFSVFVQISVFFTASCLIYL